MTSPKKKQAVITWKKTKGATGYQVYRATSKKGKYKKVATIKSTYKKIKVNGKTTRLYSNWSKVKSIKVK